MNLKFIGVGLLTSVAAISLAACSSGGSTPGVTAPQHSASTARGTIKIIYTAAKKAPSSANARKPAYVSAGFTHAALFIDGVSSGVLSSPCNAADCTITFSTTPGLHTFAVELDDTVNVLAEGSTSYTLVAGDNTTTGANLQGNPLTLNAVVYNWFVNAVGTKAGAIAVNDAAGDDILSVVGNYDNGPLTLTSNPAGAVITATDSLTSINLVGSINFTYTCGALTAPFALVVSQAATLTPSIPLTLTSPLLYGAASAPVLAENGGTTNSFACP